MRIARASLMLAVAAFGACGKKAVPAASQTQAKVDPPLTNFVGFDRNDYPGDTAMAGLKAQFAYTGFWLTPPPGENTNGWVGKRQLLKDQGYGFLVLANGRFDKQIKAAKVSPTELGKQDATAAIASAKAEGFPPKTILFLDQEEGGRLLDEQAGYLFGWTEAVAASEFRPGVYASGQPAPDGPGKTVTTIEDIREHIAKDHLHTIAIWVYQDACAPAGAAPGCTVKAPSKDASGTPEVMAWQYAQSPRRPDVTQSCAKTYAADGNCYAPGSKLLIDMNVAGSEDPSGGR